MKRNIRDYLNTKRYRIIQSFQRGQTAVCLLRDADHARILQLTFCMLSGDITEVQRKSPDTISSIRRYVQREGFSRLFLERDRYINKQLKED